MLTQATFHAESVVWRQKYPSVRSNVLLPSCSKRTVTSPTERVGRYVVPALGLALNSTSKLVTPVVVRRRTPTKPHTSSPTLSLWK